MPRFNENAKTADVRYQKKMPFHLMRVAKLFFQQVRFWGLASRLLSLPTHTSQATENRSGLRLPLEAVCCWQYSFVVAIDAVF